MDRARAPLVPRPNDSLLRIRWTTSASVAGILGACFALVYLVGLTKSKKGAFMTCIKPIPALTLIELVRVWAPTTGTRERLVQVGLFLSAIGDVVLNLHGDAWFYAGLVSFLIAHLCYIWSFSIGVPLRPWRALPWAVLPAWLAGAVLPSVKPAMVGPLLVYLIVEAGTGWRALARVERPMTTSMWVAVMGATMFMVSDGVLVMNMFVATIPRSGLVVMSTYWAAQLFLAMSVLPDVE